MTTALRGPVLVTGGTGFIGRRVIDRCLEAGVPVTSLSLPGESGPSQWSSKVKILYGDVRSSADVEAATVGAHTVIHLASLVGIAGEYERQLTILRDGTHHVCQAAARAGARAVVVSSIAVYGDRIPTGTCDEDTEHGAPQGAYGLGKQEQERMAIACAADEGLALTLIRPANVFGLGGSSAWGDKLIAAIKAGHGGTIGDAQLNDAGLTYVENLADAILLAASHPAAVGRTYNVCDENGITWHRFLHDMARLAGVTQLPRYPLEPLLQAARANECPARREPPRDPSVPFLEALNLVGYSNRIDSRRIRHELGWTPRVSYQRALAEMQTAVAA